MAVTLEFWKQNEKIFVEYNKKVYSFQEFLKLPQAENILDIIYNKITREYFDEIKDIKNKGEAIGSFIKRHFLKRDGIFDVVILDDGKLVKFNIEE
jgi:hypothetical protein